MKNLRLTLLSSIIASNGVHHGKYSNAFNSMKAIIELEEKETKNKIPKEFFDEFKSIEEHTLNLHEKLTDVPLLVVEQYFLRNAKNLNKYVYVEFMKKNVEFKVVDLYLILEEFFIRLYLLAVQIADFYNLEIKLKKSTKETEEMDFV